MWWKCSTADFARVWDPLTRWLSNGVLQRCFLEIRPTKFFIFCNFRNKVGMAIIYFFKMFKIWCRFQKMEQPNQKKFLVLTIIPFESGTTNSHNPEQDNCHWQSMCYETHLRFNISIREIFSKSASPRLMKKYDESALMPVLQEFGSL